MKIFHKVSFIQGVTDPSYDYKVMAWLFPQECPFWLQFCCTCTDSSESFETYKWFSNDYGMTIVREIKHSILLQCLHQVTLWNQTSTVKECNGRNKKKIRSVQRKPMFWCTSAKVILTSSENISYFVTKVLLKISSASPLGKQLTDKSTNPRLSPDFLCSLVLCPV